MKTLATMTALSLSIAAGAQTRVREPAPGGIPVRGEEALRIAMLAGHNAERIARGLAPLDWDDRLTADALAYASALAASAQFQHSTGRRGAEPEGENLWMGTSLDYGFDEMLGYWLAERADFQPGILPDVSRTGRFEDVSHYVQIIWPTTRRFGCAIAANDHDEYLVCRYAPPGNIRGKRLG